MRSRWEVVEGEVAAVADVLAERGETIAAAVLREVLPDGPGVPHEEHVPELARRIERLLAGESLPADLAGRLAIVSRALRDRTAALGHGGTVWVTWLDVEGYPASYTASWQGGPEGGDVELLEDVDDVADLATVLAWARARSARVMVRPDWDPDTTYWAGEGPPPAGTPELGEAPSP